MIESFFQSLEQEQVEFLLISGQAAVLYGAAEFSEDVDLWVRPTEENLERFMSALHRAGARYYKLTPPLRLHHALAGHGFHFLLGPEDVFLDVMGSPPRCRGFECAAKEANRMETDWGLVPVVSVPDLIQLKKTQRLQDYPVISRLTVDLVARRGLAGRAAGSEDRPDPAPAAAGAASRGPGSEQEIMDWAVEHVFTLETLAELLLSPTTGWDRYDGRNAEIVRRWRTELDSVEGWSEASERAATNWMQRRMAELQAQDREYWKPVIRELRRLRESGTLMPTGTAV
jgi:hypothetical protein